AEHVVGGSSRDERRRVDLVAADGRQRLGGRIRGEVPLERLVPQRRRRELHFAALVVAVGVVLDPRRRKGVRIRQARETAGAEEPELVAQDRSADRGLVRRVQDARARRVVVLLERRDGAPGG